MRCLLQEVAISYHDATDKFNNFWAIRVSCVGVCKVRGLRDQPLLDVYPRKGGFTYARSVGILRKGFPKIGAQL